MIRPRSSRWPLPLAVLLLLVAGCDNAGGREEISGTVTLKGQPLDEGFIEFHPLDRSMDHLVTKMGAMITDGKYAIRKDEGLVPGKYRVIISSGDKSVPQSDEGGPGPKNIFSKERIPAEYNVQTKQEVEVTPAGPNQFDYAIP